MWEASRVVDVTVGSQSDSLLDGYAYFSPTNPHGGTYGDSVQGTLNVTVLDIYKLKPLQGAYVQVGQPEQPGYPKYGGYTDEDGQIVFWVPGEGVNEDEDWSSIWQWAREVWLES